MSTIAAEALESAAVTPAKGRLSASLTFWIAGLVVYGGAAIHFAGGHFLDQTSRDLWQHLAALRALIDNPAHPSNPFIPAVETSRHFHPYWVSVALLARVLGWNEWQAIAFGGFFNAGVLLTGIYAFGRTFYRDQGGPLALLAAMVLGWLIPISHTGYHSIGTLIEGIAYPAVLLIGLSLLLWTLTIRALEDARWSILIAPLAALMFATHQLGAGIGFIAAGCFIAFSADGSLRNRAAATIALAIGLGAASLWPYFNPFEAILGTGNARWSGGINFYSAVQLMAAFVPQLFGLIGLCSKDFVRRARPVLAAFLTFALLFASGLFGVMIATRFIMPAVLMLHIGLGALFLQLARGWASFSDRKQLSIFGGAFLILFLNSALTYIYLTHEAGDNAKRGNAYEAAQTLTVDLPDDQPVAAYDVSVWPVIATGQKAISVPWPEPGIPDLARRQKLVETLFDPHLTRDERIALARHWDVRVLIMDKDGPLRRKMPPRLVKTLEQQSVRHSAVGPFLRFDLY